MISLQEALKLIDHILEDKYRDDVKSISNNDDTPDQIIHSMYVAGSKELKEAWGKLCQVKNYNATQGEHLLKVLTNHDLMDLAAACIEENGIVDGDLLLNKKGRFKLAQFLDKKLLDDYKIAPAAIADIIACQPASGSVAVGPGEMFLTCIIKDAVQNGGAAKGKNDGAESDAEITGDIRIGSFGVEIKGSAAAFMGQKGKPSHSDLIKNIKKMKAGTYYSKGSVKEWEKCWSAAIEHYKTPAAIATAIMDGIYSSSGQPERFKEYISMLNKDPGTFSDFSNFMISASAYSLYQYKAIEPFDYIMFITSEGNKKKNPDAFVLPVNGKSLRDLYDVLSENFTVKSCFDCASDHRIMPKIELKSA